MSAPKFGLNELTSYKRRRLQFETDTYSVRALRGRESSSMPEQDVDKYPEAIADEWLAGSLRFGPQQEKL
jgi:hypothetical protein